MNAFWARAQLRQEPSQAKSAMTEQKSLELALAGWFDNGVHLECECESESESQMAGAHVINREPWPGSARPNDGYTKCANWASYLAKISGFLLPNAVR